MIESLQRLIEALREELKNYGEMLALLDQEQEQAVSRSSTELLQTVAAITLQTAKVQQSRHYRTQCQLALSEMVGLGHDASLSTLLATIPLDYQPLLQALVEENNELLVRVQQRARQNHLLLSRSLELMQKFLSTMFPSTRTTLYNGEGSVFPTSSVARPMYEAVG